MFSQVFNMQREFPKRRFRGLLAGLSIALAVTCAGCENQTEERQNEKFREFTSLAPCIPCTLARLESVQECKVCIG